MQETKQPEAIFSGNLRRLMKDRGLTQAALATRMGVSQNAVWKWLHGTVARGAKLARLATTLGVTANELVGVRSEPLHVLAAREAPSPENPAVDEERILAIARRIQALPQQARKAIEELLKAWESHR